MCSLHFVYCLRDGHVSESWGQVFFLLMQRLKLMVIKQPLQVNNFVFGASFVKI